MVRGVAFAVPGIDRVTNGTFDCAGSAVPRSEAAFA